MNKAILTAAVAVMALCLALPTTLGDTVEMKNGLKIEGKVHLETPIFIILLVYNESGRIRSRRWQGFEALLHRSRMVIVSEEDVAEEQGLVAAFRKHAPIVIVTRADQGAMIFEGERTLTLGAYLAEEMDPTGAGDCFGAAFLVRYAETGDIEEAARFASCAGACAVEKGGIAGIPTRDAVEERMRDADVSCRWE